MEIGKFSMRHLSANFASSQNAVEPVHTYYSSADFFLTYSVISQKSAQSKLRALLSLEAAPRIELGIKDLQSSALPLGYAATRRKYNRLFDLCQAVALIVYVYCFDSLRLLFCRTVFQAL